MSRNPFDFRYSSAIVSRVAASLKDAALFQRDVKEVINVDKARQQHQDYISILRFATFSSRGKIDFCFLFLKKNWPRCY